jgi:hypothetical protein
VIFCGQVPQYQGDLYNNERSGAECRYTLQGSTLAQTISRWTDSSSVTLCAQEKAIMAYSIRQYKTKRHALTSQIVMICISSSTYRYFRSVSDCSFWT